MVENGLEGTFTGPTELHSFAGILLDMDGTIVDSIEAISKHWQNYIEGLIPKEYGGDAVEIPGARSLLAALDLAHAPWAIVTSGTRALLSGWLDVMGLSRPDNLVVAEDVSTGKPAPDCYRLGIEKLGLTAEKARAEVLVIEDSPAGVLAGKAAGCQVIAVATTHRIEQLRASGADWIVQDLQSVVLVGLGVDGTIQLEVRDALQL
ncbi:MAG: hypothetical protein Q9188_000100 [Gyalolechia gomerana]